MEKYNIPTVEEMCLDYGIRNEIDGTPLGVEAITDLIKLHVQAALQSASYKATLGYDTYGNLYFVDRKSILDAYPLTNIK